MITTIHPENKEKFEAKLAKLNRLAVKLGLPEFTSSVTKIVVIQDDLKQEMLEYEIIGDAPVIGGWTVVARVEHGENNLLFAHEELPPVYRTRQVCDHCNTTRDRNVTYVLRKDTTYKQVGGNCLSHYLPKDFEVLAGYYKFVSESEQVDWSSERQEYGVGTLHFLTVAHAMIRKFGFKKTASDFPTAYAVMGYIISKKKIELTITEQDRIDALNTITWLFDQADSDYVYNCRVIAGRDFVTFKTSGLLASAAYLSNKTASKVNEFFGEVGKRYEMTLKVVGRQYFNGSFGETVMLKFKDANENNYTWFTSHTTMEDGLTYKVKATVKAHDQKYNSTVITRVKEQ